MKMSPSQSPTSKKKMADPFTGVKKDSEDAKDAEKISTEKDETKSDSKKEADQATGATSSIFEASDDPLHPEFQPLKEISQSKHFGQALKNWIEREDLRIVARLVQLGELPGELCKPLAQLTETKVSAGLVDPCIIILLATKKVTKKLKDSERNLWCLGYLWCRGGTFRDCFSFTRPNGD